MGVDTKDGVDPETKAATVTDRKEATRAGDPKVSGVDMVDQVVMDHKEADPREDHHSNKYKSRNIGSMFETFDLTTVCAPFCTCTRLCPSGRKSKGQTIRAQQAAQEDREALGNGRRRSSPAGAGQNHDAPGPDGQEQQQAQENAIVE